VHDLVIRGGTVIDGTGSEPRTADVAIDDGRISAVGRISTTSKREINADGLAVTPGFVDIHTHYDAQATWDPHLTPSGLHGVTTAVCGNCGVGFAPVKNDEHDFLIGLMEGVEDIPGAALSAGIAWDWETFPEYLDALDRASLALDLGTQVPHGSVRAYVMGERGANNEPATTDDIAAMASVVSEGITAGALGFSTSRTILHTAVNGDPVPGTFAAEDELFGIGRALGKLGRGVFELAGAGAAGEDVLAPKREMDWMRRLSAEIQRPVTFALLQVDAAPDLWREMFDLAEEAATEGAMIYPQVAGRPFGVLIGHQSDFNLLSKRPTYAALSELAWDERMAQLRDPQIRAKILSEEMELEDPLEAYVYSAFDKVFKLGEPLNYEPAPEESVAAMAEREGRQPVEVLYDLMLEKDGRELLLFPLLNYSEMSCDPIYEMIHHPRAVLGLGDGGAHCGVICDASIQTFMLSHWVRDRTRGERIPVELAVKRMTSDTAKLYDLMDRGILAAGMKADVNLIDLDNVALELPEMVYDLPAGARRLMQRARGYEATLVSGEVIMEGGQPTDARPGRLLRGAQAGPSASRTT
jgi:N-acyl-D-aspartate/D-glutamate deacylase